MSGATGSMSMTSTRTTRVLKRTRPAPLAWKVRNWATYRRRELPARLGAAIAGLFGVATIKAELRALVRHADGTITDYGVLSRRLVTTAGVGYIVDAFQNIVELEEMKYHGFGTGTNSEAAGDTALQTELTTQYVTNNIRPTGTTTEGASANIYRTVATLSPDSGGTIAVTEHGVLSDPDVGQGVLFDRSVFSAVNIVAAQDSLQMTYEVTLSSGG